MLPLSRRLCFYGIAFGAIGSFSAAEVDIEEKTPEGASLADISSDETDFPREAFDDVTDVDGTPDNEDLDSSESDPSSRQLGWKRRSWRTSKRRWRRRCGKGWKGWKNWRQKKREKSIDYWVKCAPTSSPTPSPTKKPDPATPKPTPKATPAPTNRHKVYSGEKLFRAMGMRSANGKYWAEMGLDGYFRVHGQKTWIIGGGKGHHLEIQKWDNHLVLWSMTTPIWSTGVFGHAGRDRLELLDNGNFVQYREDNTVAWTANTQMVN